MRFAIAFRESIINMLPWITLFTLVVVVLAQGKPSVSTSVKATDEAVINKQQKINEERTKPLRYRRRRILQVEDSPFFKDEVYTFVESSTERIAGSKNKRSDAAYRPFPIRSVFDIDVWSRLLQSDMSMSLPTPTTSDAQLVSPTSSPVIKETDVPTADAPSDTETVTPTKTPSEASECDSLNRTNAIQVLLEGITDTSYAEVSIDSPQGMAFDWITTFDNATDPCTDSESTVTRFALATFYYSTNGENWTDSTNWISSAASQCTWYGITCNDDGDVDEFQLGT